MPPLNSRAKWHGSPSSSVRTTTGSSFPHALLFLSHRPIGTVRSSSSTWLDFTVRRYLFSTAIVFGLNLNMLSFHPRASGNMVNHNNILRSVQYFNNRPSNVRQARVQSIRSVSSMRAPPYNFNRENAHIQKLSPRLNMCSLAREVIPLRVFMLIYASTLKSTCDVIRAECSGLLASSPSAYLRVLIPQLLSLNSALSTEVHRN